MHPSTSSVDLNRANEGVDAFAKGANMCSTVESTEGVK